MHADKRIEIESTEGMLLVCSLPGAAAVLRQELLLTPLCPALFCPFPSISMRKHEIKGSSSEAEEGNGLFHQPGVSTAWQEDKADPCTKMEIYLLQKLRGALALWGTGMLLLVIQG